MEITVFLDSYIQRGFNLLGDNTSHIPQKKANVRPLKPNKFHFNQKSKRSTNYD